VHDVSGDLSYTWRDTKVLRAGFDPTQFAVLAQGSPLLRRPKHSASAGLQYALPNGFAATARATYVGHRIDHLFHGAPDYNTEVVRLAPYTKLDLSAMVPLRIAPLSLSFRADNVTNTHYQSVAGFATPGRVLMAGLRAAF